MKSRSFASLALGAAALGVVMTPAGASPFPAIGNATGGPYAIIDITGGGNSPLVGTIVAGSGQTYDNGNDDVYYGVENNTLATVIRDITLTGSGIFGFENDGIGAGPTYPGPGSCLTTAPCTTKSGVDNSGGYGGPISHFSITDVNDGSVFFGMGLAPGDTTIFALEAPASTVSVTGINTAETPLPAALPLFAGGLGIIGLVAGRKRRKAATTATA
jgi:hypothetical protein